MTELLACVVCAIDPQAGSMVGPVIQAAVITLPFVFRGQVVATVRRARRRMRGVAESQDVSAPAEPAPKG